MFAKYNNFYHLILIAIIINMSLGIQRAFSQQPTSSRKINKTNISVLGVSALFCVKNICELVNTVQPHLIWGFNDYKESLFKLEYNQAGSYVRKIKGISPYILSNLISISGNLILQGVLIVWAWNNRFDVS